MHIITEENVGASEMTPEEKEKALLHHMIHHNEQHLEEFCSLRDTLSGEGKSSAAEELSQAIACAEKLLSHLNAAFDAMR